MSIPLTSELGRIDEPRVADEYAAVFSQVATGHRAVIVRRNGQDLAAVVPLEHLELISEELARQEVEKKAARLPWDRLPNTLRPPQSWFDDEEDNLFESEEKPVT